ncbi:MAG: translocation/assembly module TamB domain-containing protein [Bacteroidota bacterium]
MSKPSPPLIESFFGRLRRRRIIRLVWKFFKRFFVVCLFLLFGLWFLLQSERFQNWAIGKTTTFLSEELNTEIEVGHIDIDFFNKLVLEDFFLADQRGDTLLYSRELKTSLSANLLGILGGELDIDDIYLEDAIVHIQRDSNQRQNNFAFILDYLKKPKKKKKKKKAKTASKPFLLDIDAVYLTNVHFIKQDVPKGQLIDVLLPRGKILVDELLLDDNQFRLKEVELSRPIVRIAENERMPLPKEPKPTLIVLKEEQSDTKDSAKTKKPLQLELARLRLTNGIFYLDNYRKAPERVKPLDVVDFEHLALDEITLAIDSFAYSPDNYSGIVERISCREQSGFVLRKLSAERAKVTNRRLELTGMELMTPQSHLRDTLIFKYRSFSDFDDFEDRVLMDGRFKKSKVALKDVMAFAPKLNNNNFFAKNQEEVIQLDGRLSGRVNNLRGRNLLIRLGRRSYFKGSFSSRNLAIKNEEALNLKLERLRTDMQTLRLLIPNFNPPKNFDKLGRIDFSGRFDGFFVDFVAYGELQSELGKATMDMRMDLRRGRDLAEYSGQLSLESFDLARWADDDRLGKVTFRSEVKNGVGLTLETVDVKLGANIQSFTFKDYTYENLAIEGKFNQKLFDGKLNIKDDNIDLAFDGALDFSDSIPLFNFRAQVNELDLKSLNLSKQNFVLAGKVDIELRDKNFANMTGHIVANDLMLQKDDSLRFVMDTLSVVNTLLDNGDKSLLLHSELINLQMIGRFDIDRLGDVFTGFIEKNYTELADRFGIRSSGKPLPVSRFGYNLDIHDTKNLTELFVPGLDTLRDIVLKGLVDTYRDTISLLLDIPALAVNNLQFEDIILQFDGNDKNSLVDLGVYHTVINNKQHFEPLSLQADIQKDTVAFELNATNFNNILDNLNLNGRLFFVDDMVQISFLPSDLVILQDRWSIDPSNYLRFNKKRIETEAFRLTLNDRIIELENIGNRGLKAHVEGFDLSLIDEIWDYSKLDFNGRFTVEVSAQDIFKLQELELSVMADTMFVNGDDWGVLRIDANMPTTKHAVQGYVSITKDDQQLITEGYFAPPKSIRQDFMKYKYEFNGNISNFPLYIAEYWIAGGVDNTKGSFDAEVKIYGDRKPRLKGELQIRNLETTIEYLNTRYTAESGTVKMNDEYFFDASGNTIKDRDGRVAYVTGGITHKWLKNLGLNATINSPEFLVLNTTKEDSDLYYGTAIAGGEVKFTGNFNQTNIDIDAFSRSNSELFIPLTEDRDASEISFIKLINKEDRKIVIDKKKNRDLRGVELNMNLSFNDAAQVSMIFDERTRDIMRGRGNGDIQIFISRSGNFTMYGNYDITEGEYLYTWMRFVNKPFAIQEGGNIRWSGDPYNAQINIEAEYKGLTSPLTNFLFEYLNDDQVRQEARQSSSVDLTMLLSGQLQKPDISFDINFPKVTGELRNYTDSKMRILRGDPNELNRQVFGLMVIGSFLPSGQSTFAGNESLIPINTVSEWVANQLSIYVTELLSEAITGGAITGVDVDFNYNFYQSNELDLDDEQIIRSGSELGLDFKLLLNDRLELNLGGNIDFSSSAGGSSNAQNYPSGEIIFEYAITDNRRLKVRGYLLSDQTLLTSRRNKYGLGLRYSKEFETLKEFFQNKKKKD